MDWIILAIISGTILLSYVIFWKHYQYIVGLIILMSGLMLITQATTTETTQQLIIYDNDSSTTIKDYNFTTEDSNAYNDQQAINMATMSMIMIGLGVILRDGLKRTTGT